MMYVKVKELCVLDINGDIFMRINKINKCECTNGLGVGVSVFTQGCPYHCKDCFNPETWDYNGGEEWTPFKKNTVLELIKPDYITRLSVLGGEPLIKRNLYFLSDLIKSVKEIKPDIKIWVYTGNIYEVLLTRIKEYDEKYLEGILNNIDVLVDGPFIQEQKDLTLAFRGSSNQRIIDMLQTKELGKVVTLDL